jgi:hypothetical protein
MSVSDVPQPIRYMLWGKAAGRCQYRGCNKPLHIDQHTKAEFNQAYIAHIVADSPEGPRGDSIRSPQLAKDISNLMLLCDSHHRLIDKKDVEGHPESLLQEMKFEHETRISLVTDIQDDMYSQVVLYGSNIGEHTYPVSRERTVSAMIPHRYPADHIAIEFGWKNSSFYDHEEKFWDMERENLKRQFDTQLKPLLASGKYRHISVFALAPQPLLISLGTLISDICPADVYQLQREPEQSWKWQNQPQGSEFIILEPQHIHSTVAINFSLSATIDPSRITDVLGKETSLWTVTIPEPNNDFMKSKDQLMMFRIQMRKLMDRMKLIHGQDSCIHVFPAMPVSTAVELGRIWMPKADLPLILYDNNPKKSGFTRTFEIKSSEREVAAL